MLSSPQMSSLRARESSQIEDGGQRVNVDMDAAAGFFQEMAVVVGEEEDGLFGGGSRIPGAR